ncbi:MAG: hypothetical protein UW46_C0005G0003 [Candidatus Yanofskybacteria bacterium GW2011_GWF1_44_227]|uniref:Uncharacterized protein n=1 Tax=Candidatus Yanofskybacteria bacterium GW2011_GWE2_40_11 TaxID=1619033 RepID=A0A0G0QUD4_9BACT|nr:MAG: hypothetical protein UT75_C0002G0003 [Candidatus Yanofskybacteria bacterium GW2011_GWE2_40_11]KKT15554.1 MAG: hypothetical protein UV97_C0005G0047 [Candidatus Yanofskybacteria bacterium GW2011_GWF2_43_596]KKT53197.1 MAG: hypothetical protein UW46_C0005G0003 [Candidatus Yanofskybacteria bacterium GW2011_GWF1_44_227]OGN35592.1 MAG: hypothetical protein A2207_02535 [Candidatus Yanofskybacteria bacterium RIFOXYA1_FULL_44_17]OGN36703.1 MAG: hypothetical protein A2241_02845 [Candidatus Yanofs
MDKRSAKQFFIGAIYLIIFALLAYGIYAMFFKVVPTCTDSIQNGKEVGVDCGIQAGCEPCGEAIKPIDIISSQLIKVNEGDYDFVAQATNPNTELGSSRVDFDLVYKSSDGTEKISPDFFYIAPGQTKYIVRQRVQIEDIASVEIKIKNAAWSKLDIATEPVNFVVKKDYVVVNADGVHSQVLGTVYNPSNYDLSNVDVAVVLYGESNKIIAVNKTDIKTLNSQSERQFKVFWTKPFAGTYYRADVEVTTNLFDNSNFIKAHGSTEEFQRIYEKN